MTLIAEWHAIQVPLTLSFLLCYGSTSSLILLLCHAFAMRCVIKVHIGIIIAPSSCPVESSLITHHSACRRLSFSLEGNRFDESWVFKGRTLSIYHLTIRSVASPLATPLTVHLKTQRSSPWTELNHHHLYNLQYRHEDNDDDEDHAD